MRIDKNEETTHCQLCISHDWGGAVLMWDNDTENWEYLEGDSPEVGWGDKGEFFTRALRWNDGFKQDYPAEYRGAIAKPKEMQTALDKLYYSQVDQERVDFCEEHWISDGGEENNEERKK